MQFGYHTLRAECFGTAPHTITHRTITYRQLGRLKLIVLVCTHFAPTILIFGRRIDGTRR